MKVLETWVASPLAVAVGWTLLHSLWEGAIITAVLAATLVAVRSPRARYAAACVSMLMMLVAMVVTFIRVTPAGLVEPAIRSHASPDGMSTLTSILVALGNQTSPQPCLGLRRFGWRAF